MLAPLLLFLASAQDPAAIMEKVAAHVAAAAASRRQFVYREKVRSTLTRSNGKIARLERREFSVVPNDMSTEKKLTSFSGEYRKGSRMVPYSEPGFRYKGLDLDGDLIEELTDDLTNEKDSRDGIPHSLFPLTAKVLPRYNFTFLGEVAEKDRLTYHIAFEPKQKSSNCIRIGAENECDTEVWKGEAWIDAEELQPVRLISNLVFKMPWAVKAFLGTNLRQTGFTVNYTRVAPNVWFPATYGTEFRLDVLWGYKRTISLSLESSDFQRTQADSTIRYATSSQ